MVESEKAARQRKDDKEAKHRARSGRRNDSGAGSSSGGSRERSRRHDDADREAKRRAKRGSGGGEEAKPGAAFEKTSRGASSRSLGTRGSSHRSNRDQEDRAAKQRARSGGSRSRRPGVETVAADDSTEARARRKQNREDSSKRSSASRSGSRRRSSDEKARDRRGTRAFKPGAEAATSSSDRSRAKSGSRNNSERSVNVAANEGAPQFNEDGEAVVAATLIEEEKEDEDVIKERERARIRETERERLQKEAEKERLEREEAERQEKELEEKKKKKKKRNMVICVILVVLVIAGGVAAFFALQGDSSSDDAVTQTTIPQEETSVPSSGPTDDPSSAPTNVPLKYEQPDSTDCERIASGLPIDGEDEMFDRSFAIATEVSLLVGNDIDPLVPELKTKIEKLLVPDLIGCPRGLFNKRRLGLHHGQSQASMSNVSYHHHRELQNMSIRYAIAKAIASVTVTDDACDESSSPNCSVVTVNLDLKVRGDENIGLLAEVIQSFFPNGEDIRPAIELIAPFDTIVIGVMRSLDPTTAPSIAPTGIASENPSGGPSNSPSTSPTSAPGTGPTDPAPVVAPTKAPSKAPTPPPTLAPTPTPSPTLAPQPGLTPQPTPPPTKSPTKVPTKSPTPPPTVAPQPGLTPQPTPPPTIALSMSPSTYPSPEPSLVPSTAPSTKPSLMPSEGPTIQASLAPSPMPSSDPSSGPTPAPALESDLYCGCYADVNFIARDLPHTSPYVDLSQVGCINYCTSQGYSFAGLQFKSQCFCGDDAGSYGTSINCFTMDANRDGNPDVCVNSGVGACYDGSNSCSCGGGDANILFRTSQAVSCPPQVPPAVPQDWLGCFEDRVPRDLNVFGFKATLTIEKCRSFCRDSGFPYCSIQSYYYCYCGNSYANIRSTPNECQPQASRNTVFYSGAAMAQVADLDEDLYCGCYADSTSQRVSEHMSPDYELISQKGCIYYCRSQGYDYAGLRNHKCFCRADPGSYSTSQNCNAGCALREAACCYDGSQDCSVGGQVGSDLFQDIYRTRSGLPCP